MKRLILVLLVLLLASSVSFAVPPNKPTTLADGDRLTATWVNGMVNVVYEWCQNHGIASGATHGISGDFVGTTDTQTISGKTLTNPTINAATMSGTLTCSGTVTLNGTVSGGTITPTSIGGGNATGNITANGGVTFDGVDVGAHAADTTTAHGATGAVVGTTNSQTLTNKTMTSPTLNTPTIAGGNISVNVTAGAGVTVDGVDIGAHDAATTSVHGAVSTNTASRIVTRDGSGNFAAGTITANLTGNCSGSSGSCTGNSSTATTAITANKIRTSAPGSPADGDIWME